MLSGKIVSTCLFKLTSASLESKKLTLLKLAKEYVTSGNSIISTSCCKGPDESYLEIQIYKTKFSTVKCESFLI